MHSTDLFLSSTVAGSVKELGQADADKQVRELSLNLFIFKYTLYCTDFSKPNEGKCDCVQSIVQSNLQMFTKFSFVIAGA